MRKRFVRRVVFGLTLVVTVAGSRAAQAAWQLMTPLNSQNGGCGGMKFLADTHGLVFCDNKVFSTIDGMTWGTGVGVPQAMLSLTPAEATFLGEKTWLVHGQAIDVSMSLVGRTTDGGMSWTKVPLTGTANGPGAIHVTFLDDKNGLAYGSASVALLAVTKDGGATWKEVAMPFIPISEGISTFTLAAAMADPMKWVVTVMSISSSDKKTYVQHTTDGGATWTECASGAPGAQPVPALVLMQAIDANTVIGNSNSGNVTFLWVSADGGATFNAITPGPDKNMFRSFSAMTWKDANNGLLGHQDGYILRTTDGGKNWTAETVPAAWEPNNGLPRIAGFDWPGPSAYAYTSANNNKIVLRDPAAGSSSPPPPPDGGPPMVDAAMGRGGTGGSAAGTGAGKTSGDRGGGGCALVNGAPTGGAAIALLLAAGTARRRRGRSMI